MRLVEVKQNEKDNYNRFIIANGTGSFLQSFEWGEWQAALGRQVSRFWIESDEGQTVGSIQLIKMPMPLAGFYLYAPYGPIIGRSEKSEVGKIGSRILDELKNKFPSAVFIRIEPKDNQIIQSLNHSIIKSANIQPGKTLILDLKKTEEELLEEMHPKTRYNIKVAQRHGVEIQDEFGITVNHGLYFDEAINLLVQTGKRQGFVNYPKSYFERMVDYFTLHHQGEIKLHIYKALYKEKLLTSAIFIDFGKTRTFLFGGSSAEDKNVMAPYLLHYSAMLDAKKDGMEYYDFWGTETAKGDVPGFVRFKLGFAPSIAEKVYAGAYDYVLKKWNYRFYKGARQMYRMIK